jgi:chromosome segregation ATPase
MLTGTELASAIAAVLLGAMAAGALLHWLWARLHGGAPGEARRIAELSERLHEAEMAREAAELACQEAETRLAELQASFESRIAEREAAMGRELAEATTDLAAMHEGLIHARRRVLELEAELEQLTRQAP